MGKQLVIVESPPKAKTIKGILGGDFVVKSSVGHVRDLPVKKFGVDLKNGFAPQYVIMPGKEKVVRELVQEAKGCEAVYLAPDPDREGEAIAWHLQTLLEKAAPKAKFYRVSYNEITPRGVTEAFSHPTLVNMSRVCAQQARRVLDRIVGYKVTPLLWTRVGRGCSAGRVQSVALRLVCEREREIQRFVAEPYWVMGVQARKLIAPLDPFEMRLIRINGEKADITNAEKAVDIMADLEGRGLRITRIVTREVQRKPFPPFITSTLQQAASSFLGYSPSRTMRLAQKLYEGVDLAGETVGLITYMRTDCVSVSSDALSDCRNFIVKNFGDAFLPAKPNSYKSRTGAQEAHEAIRPTSAGRTPDSVAGSLNPAELKLYRLIWERFVASQMSPARIRQVMVEAEAPPPDGNTSVYLFRASSPQVVFPGYMKVWRAAAAVEKDQDQIAQALPPLSEGEALESIRWLTERKETTPPRRFSQASLIHELEQNGVGRPSTYQQIMSTLIDRNYATIMNKALVATTLGLKVNDFLMEDLSALFDVKFTAGMEAKLDEVEGGKVEWTAMIGEFYSQFSSLMDKTKSPVANVENVRLILRRLEEVTGWAPATKYGKRSFSDEKFTASIRAQLEKGTRPVSERQLAAIVRLCIRYEDQIPGIRDMIRDAGLSSAAAISPEDDAARRNDAEKLALLKTVKCADPVERGKRVYDDRAFIDSLTGQSEAGRLLSPAQRKQVDRLILKYSEQIPDIESLKQRLGLVEDTQVEDTESAGMLLAASRIVEWRPPVERGKKTFDDKLFLESLSRQYKQKGRLSLPQRAALKRVLGRYGIPIAGHDETVPSHVENEERDQNTEAGTAAGGSTGLVE